MSLHSLFVLHDITAAFADICNRHEALLVTWSIWTKPTFLNRFKVIQGLKGLKELVWPTWQTVSTCYSVNGNSRTHMSTCAIIDEEKLIWNTFKSQTILWHGRLSETSLVHNEVRAVYNGLFKTFDLLMNSQRALIGFFVLASPWSCLVWQCSQETPTPRERNCISLLTLPVPATNAHQQASRADLSGEEQGGFLLPSI